MPENADSEADNTALPGRNAGSPSHLFLVRLWTESDNAGEAVWCGKVQHVTRGRANQFRDWPALIDLFMALLPTLEPVRQQLAADDPQEPEAGA
jgi:hypothetical protein